MVQMRKLHFVGRCEGCHGSRGKVIAVVEVERKPLGGKGKIYHYRRFTHRKTLRDGTVKRTYCYVPR